MDIFSILGIEAPKEEKKQANGKKETKKSKKQTTAGKTETKYDLPLTVVTGWREPGKIEGAEAVTMEQLRERIHALYPEYGTRNMAVHVEKQVVYVGFKNSKILTKGTRELDNTVKCCLGSESFDISEVFDGTEKQEVDVADISNVLERICPIFRGCSIVTDGDILVPVFTQSAYTDQKLMFPINVLLFGRGTMQITKQQYADAFAASGTAWNEADGTVSARALTDMVLKQWADLNQKFTVLLYDKEQNMILVTQQVGEEETVEKKSSASSESYPTENTTLSVIFQKLPLSPELFGGKKKVTKKEMQEYVAGIFPEYSGDNVDFVYNKETRIIVPVLRGSRKGALDMVFSEQEYEEKIKNQSAVFSYMYDGVLYRVQSTPVMLTACSMNGSGEGWHSLRVPLIPQYVLKAVYEFFKFIAYLYSTEVRIQVYYDSLRGEYVLHLPRQEVTAASVYTTEAEYLLMSETMWPVLDIHSHCRFPAMWSGIDNANELGNWIFGVIGSLGSGSELKLRVGTGGCFLELLPDKVFDYAAIDDAKAEALYNGLCADVSEKLTFVENS